MILTFLNTRTVIQAERELKNNGISYQVIPTPRQISSECGMCLKVSSSDLGKIEDLFQAQGIKINSQIPTDKIS